MIEKYEHHGNDVWVQSHLKGKHREHCLCLLGCLNFRPGHVCHCNIAAAVYKNCVEFGLVTPMYECPEFSTLDLEQVRTSE